MTPALFPELAEPETARAHAPDPAPTGPDPSGPVPKGPAPNGRRLALSRVAARTALVRQNGTANDGGPWFDWSANPYRGCKLGCGYCSARYSHETSMVGNGGHTDPQHVERSIYVKEGFVDALRHDLRRRVRPGEHIAFGTATDPYQPLEKRERVTFRALSALLDCEGLAVSITTKSTLIARDAKLLALLSERHAVRVSFSITTPDARLARFLEPRAPAPAKRLEALAHLRRHGVEAGVFLMPLLPGVTDAEPDVDALLGAAAAAGARWLASQVVFLREPSRTHFLRGLRRSYPRVAARYAWWTCTSAAAADRMAAGGTAQGGTAQSGTAQGGTAQGGTASGRGGSGGRLPEHVRDEALGRVRRLAVRHGLSAHAGLPLPTPRRGARQATFAFSAP